MEDIFSKRLLEPSCIIIPAIFSMLYFLSGARLLGNMNALILVHPLITVMFGIISGYERASFVMGSLPLCALAAANALFYSRISIIHLGIVVISLVCGAAGYFASSRKGPAMVNVIGCSVLYWLLVLAFLAISFMSFVSS